MEKELTNVPGLNPSDVVVIKTLGYGSLSQLRSRSTTAQLNKIGGVNATLDFGLYSKWCIVYGIKSAPFFPSGISAEEKGRIIDNDGIESETGEFLFKEIQVLNRFDQNEETKKK